MSDPTTPPPADQPAAPSHAEPAVTSAPASKVSNVKAWAVGGVALIIALCCGGIALGAVTAGDDEPSATASGPTASPSSAAPTTASPNATTPNATPSTAQPTTAVPTTTLPAPKPKPPSYKALTERQWKLVAKNPDAYLGKTYVVYGRVTQFDAATGTDTFRANVAHRRMAEKYDYETNTLLNGDETQLENLVDDDIFRANVTVLGSFSYDTQIGGETTVPLLKVDSIKVL
ncbi:hypothetical protein ACPFP2_26060 [Micromonospora citrea]|uniref:hypothetical protein n=1 Tax=Micromonospora citrea TaxID=47855 RepID=UPI003C5DC3EE